MTVKGFAAIAIAAASLAAPAALAQEAATTPPPAEQGTTTEEAREGAWKGSELTGTTAIGENGREIGTVVDAVVTEAGALRRVIVETPTGRLAVPWAEVDLAPYAGTATMSLDAAEPGDDTEPGAFKEPREWRLTSLIGMPVQLTGMREYGTVTDLLFDRETSELVSYVITPERPGPARMSRVLPWQPAWIDYEQSMLHPPYTLEAIETMEPLTAPQQAEE